MCLTLCGVRTFEQGKRGTMRDRQRRKKKKVFCCDVWRAGLKWHSTHLPFVSPSLCRLCVRSRCWGGLGEGSGERSAVSVPASWAESGLILQGLPLLWQVLPHLPSSQSPSADTHRSVRLRISLLQPNAGIECISPAIKYLLYFMQNLLNYLYWHSFWG